MGSAEADHFLIRINRSASLGAVRSRQDARVRDGHHGESRAADNDVVEVSKTNHRQCKRWQSLWQRPKNLHASGRIEVQYTDDNSRSDDREQKTRDVLVGLEQKNCYECAGADCERRPVRLSAENAFADAHEIAQWTDAIDRETEELRQLADQHGKRDSVHVAVADRLREKLRD